MLVLSRQLNEELCIGDGIVVIVLAIEKSTVKLGIIAPGEIAVLRREAKVKEPKHA